MNNILWRMKTCWWRVLLEFDIMQMRIRFRIRHGYWLGGSLMGRPK